MVTRLLFSSSPLLYMAAAAVTSPGRGGDGGAIASFRARARESRARTLDPLRFLWRDSLDRGPCPLSVGDLVEAYFVAYLLLGFLLFPNNFPWT